MHSAVEEHLKSMQKPVFPEFVVEPVKMEFASTQAGRPIFEDREFVKIHVVGNRGAQAHEPVNDEHKARWPVEYAAFKAGMELPTNGTPLAEWANPQMTKSKVLELAYFNIRTIEDVAALNDNALQNLGMGARQLREAAQLYLEVAAKGTGPMMKILEDRDRLAVEVTRLVDELTEANREISALKKERVRADA